MIPQLSVLICIRNRPEKVERAVSSVLANTFRDVELIFVDRGTDDETRDRLRAIGDPRLQYYATNTVGVAIAHGCRRSMPSSPPPRRRAACTVAWCRTAVDRPGGTASAATATASACSPRPWARLTPADRR